MDQGLGVGRWMAHVLDMGGEVGAVNPRNPHVGIRELRQLADLPARLLVFGVNPDEDPPVSLDEGP